MQYRTRTTSLFVIMATASLIFMTAAAKQLHAKLPQPDAKNTTMPLKVFILAGQSNMQGHAHVRTFDTIGMDPKTAPILDEMRNADGTPRICEHVWISSIGSADEEQVGRLTAGFGAKVRGPKIGPEFTFGIYMQKLLDEPILIIKTAWGGKSLHTDFRPPSAGPYEFNESQLERLKKQGKDIEAIKADRVKATGHGYRLMINHVRNDAHWSTTREKTYSPNRIREYKQQHRSILEAIQARDIETAVELIKLHMTELQRDLMRDL